LGKCDSSFPIWAVDISSNGSVIVGAGASDSGREAFRWENNVMTGLGDLEGGAFSSLAFSVSADGSVVVGASSSSLSGLEYEAFRWEDGVMVGLGDLEGGQHPIWFNSEAWDVSSDGSVVVGVGTSYSGDEAFIWDSTDGMRNLKYVLMYDKFSRSSLGDKLHFGRDDIRYWS